MNKEESKSAHFRKKLSEEENDLIAMGLHKKVKREENSETFYDVYLTQLKQKCYVEYDAKTEKFTFMLQGFGKVSLFPKANKIHFHKSNQWKYPAIKWLIEKGVLK